MPETSTVDFNCKEHFANKIYKQILKVSFIRSLKTLPHNVYEPITLASHTLTSTCKSE